MTEPPRFLPMASISPPLNFIAAIPIKKGVAAIIAVLLIHLIWSDTADGVCAQGIPPTLGGGGAGSQDNLEEGPLPVAPLPNNLCQHLLKWRGVKRRDDSEALGVVQKAGRVRGFSNKRSFPIIITPRSTGYHVLGMAYLLLIRLSCFSRLPS